MATETVTHAPRIDIDIELANASARIQSALDALFGMASRLEDDAEVGTVYCITHCLEGAKAAADRAGKKMEGLA